MASLFVFLVYKPRYGCCRRGAVSDPCPLAGHSSSPEQIAACQLSCPNDSCSLHVKSVERKELMSAKGRRLQFRQSTVSLQHNHGRTRWRRRLHHFLPPRYVSPHCFSPNAHIYFIRCTLHTLDRRLSYSLEISNHRRTPLDCSLLLFHPYQRSPRAPLFPLCHPLPRRHDYSMELWRRPSWQSDV